MRVIYLLISSMLLLASCNNNSLEYTIPAELEGNEQAIEIMNEMASAAGDCQLAMQKAVKFSVQREGDSTKELSAGEGIKAGLAVSRVMLAKNNMDEAKEKAKLLREDLSPEQMRVLENVLADLESQIGNIDTKKIGLSDEELARLEADEDINFGNMLAESPEKKAVRDSLEAEAAYVAEQHKLHNEWLRSQGRADEITDYSANADNSVETPMWLGIAFPILVLLLMLGFFILKARRFYRGIRKVADDVSYAKNQFKK
ncbi:hypothetical protein [Carboxylicivirga sp. N1Y90]|uniref:hypothetical protein n=1 Tax=Carboxylicivirga fragile TaxID=3417571 RepID=UPI003D3341A4|nr:hypothetical protein [Marinilabiliaceae bacterium N1Y90]